MRLPVRAEGGCVCRDFRLKFKCAVAERSEGERVTHPVRFDSIICVSTCVRVRISSAGVRPCQVVFRQFNSIRGG